MPNDFSTESQGLPHSSDVETPCFRFEAKGNHCGTCNGLEMRYTSCSPVTPHFMKGLAEA